MEASKPNIGKFGTFVFSLTLGSEVLDSTSIAFPLESLKAALICFFVSAIHSNNVSSEKDVNIVILDKLN